MIADILHAFAVILLVEGMFGPIAGIVAEFKKPSALSNSPTSPVEHDPTPKNSTPGGHI